MIRNTANSPDLTRSDKDDRCDYTRIAINTGSELFRLTVVVLVELECEFGLRRPDSSAKLH